MREDIWIVVKCKTCGKDIRKRRKDTKIFCSVSCKNEYQRGKTLEERLGKEKSDSIRNRLSESNSGENNPNYGNRWTDEQKAKHSSVITNVLSEKGEEWRKENLGKSNRGKVRSEDFKKKWHARSHEPRRPHSQEERLKIGQRSKEKFTAEFKERQRKVMESLGYWTPLKDVTDWEIYKKETHWIEKMWDKIYLPEDFRDVGVFNCRTNRNGYTRDHILSKKDGFVNQVFPELLRHPVNCECILHSINASKGAESKTNINALFNKIKTYDGDWIEQDKCLDLIVLFESGKRWSRHYE